MLPYSWDLLRELSEGCDLPWLVLGDFNEIMFSHEKQGGQIRDARNMEQFGNALEDCDLFDVGFRGL